ncbi:MAG: winged helix-turn-helix transcriptional regulator [Thermoplasmata archaeon]|nr:MAG: winged helix-turn-helix transcriptional regulator [Thermoplasmata archaeon]
MTKELDLETRREIFELISNFPGLHFREILRRLDTSSGNLNYQLNYMIKHDILVGIQDGNLKRYYLIGKVKGKEKRILACLRNETSRGLVLFLLLNPNSKFNELSLNFDLAPSKLAYHLKKLLDKEIIEKKRKGRTTLYKVVDEESIANVLISYKPSFLDGIVDNFIEAWSKR